MTLATPEKIRDLQRALYLRAKQQPTFRFYALYDKVYRADIVAHAYALCRANAGAAGPDGITFAQIEEAGASALLTQVTEQLRTKTYRPGPVRRVYIPKADGGERPLGVPNIIDRVVQMAVKLVLEPIFEADFEADSYGFRPKKSAHQALEAIRESVGAGMAWVIDADIEQYFDSIPHDRLMKVVASRVVDSSLLRLVKMFLTAPVIDERKGGGPRRPAAGTPQGGVISPLLSNIYLHLLDKSFRKRTEGGDLQGRLIRYCDDFVLLARQKPEREMSWLRAFMARLGLRLHPEKTRMVNTEEEGFDFLGYHVWRKQRELRLDLSRRSRRRIGERLREATRRTFQPVEQMVTELNTYIAGARAYFRLAPWWSLRRLDSSTTQRVARWYRKKLGEEHPAWSRVSGNRMTTEYGLKRWAPRPPWDKRGAWAGG
jgi:RNA-directed DNA polymerase